MVILIIVQYVYAPQITIYSVVQRLFSGYYDMRAFAQSYYLYRKVGWGHIMLA